MVNRANIGMALAALLAVGIAGWLATERTSLGSRVRALQQENGSLNERVNDLSAQIDELKNGFDRRLGIAQSQWSIGKLDDALDSVHDLLKIHPQAISDERVLDLKEEIEEQLAQRNRLAEEVARQKAEEERIAAERKRQQELSKGLVAWSKPPDKLAPDFIGTDIKNLVRAIEAMGLPTRDEFTSPAELRARTDKAFHSKEVGIFESNSLFAFQPNGLYDSEPEYDAEKKRYTARAAHILRLADEEEDRGSYIASNAFGVAKEVSLVTERSWGVVFDNYDHFRKKLSYYEQHSLEHADVALPIPPDAARQLNGKLKVLYLARLVYPYLSTSSDYEKPTIDRPREANSYSENVHARIAEILIWRTDTGEILARTKF